MLNKNKNKKRFIRRTILLLIFIILMPMASFAGVHSGVKDWEDYKDKVEKDILNQETEITINFTGMESFSTDQSARSDVEAKLEEVIKKLPNYLQKLNIKNIKTSVALEGRVNVSYAPLKTVSHIIEYKNSKAEVGALKKLFNEKYNNEIKFKETDYEKIKTAYDYINNELEKFENDGNGEEAIKAIFNSHKENPHTFLFALMMTELGYENDIASSKSLEGYKWNIVKVQGKWYHVDYKVKTGDYSKFLINIADKFWKKDEYKNANYTFADKDYKAEDFQKLQIEYEILLIGKEVEKLSEEVGKLFKEEISMASIKEGQKQLQIVEGKLNKYQGEKDKIRSKIEELGEDGLFKEEISMLETSIGNISKEIKDKKELIITQTISKAEDTLKISDIEIAQEAIRMMDNKDEKEYIDALKSAVVAVETLENKKQKDDIEIANDLLDKLSENPKVIEKVIEKLSARIDKIILEIETIEGDEALIIQVSKAVEKAEESLKDKEKSIDEIETDIKDANEAIIAIVKDKYKASKENLEARIDLVQATVNAMKASDEIKEYILSDIYEVTSLEDVIKSAEIKLKIAEESINKDIQDTKIKEGQRNKIKEIKLAIASIKAVDKAETSKPLKMTNVNSAAKAIEKLNIEYWVSNDEEVAIVEKLNNRLKVIDDKIRASNLESTALKAVEKAEKTMKASDIELARIEVDLFEISDIKPDVSPLKNRLNAIDTINKMEKALSDYLLDQSEYNLKKLSPAIGQARSAILSIKKLDIENVITKYEDKLAVAVKTRSAIEEIKKAGNTPENQEILSAKEAIEEVKDSKIKKQLEKELKVIIDKKEKEDKLQKDKEALLKAKQAVDVAKDSLTILANGFILEDNINFVTLAEEDVKLLPNSPDKKYLQAIIKELNSAIKVKEMLETAEKKLVDENLTVKDVTALEKILDKLNRAYREHKPVEEGPNLDERLEVLKSKLGEEEAAELFAKAEIAVKKSEETKQVKDISSAKKVIALIKDEDEKNGFMVRLEILEVEIGKEALKVAETSAKNNSKSLSKDIATAKKAVDPISSKDEYDKTNLNARIIALENYASTIKALENAEKTINQVNINTFNIEFNKLKEAVEKIKEVDRGIYTEERGIIENINKRIAFIEEYMSKENEKISKARTQLGELEASMIANIDPDNILIQEAQKLVDEIVDKTIKLGLQKTIDSIQVVKAAKLEVIRAEAYPNEKSVKDAENALKKVDGIYGETIKDLSERIGKLMDQLNTSKKITEATNLVFKAMDTRKISDIERARIVVDSLADLDEKSFHRLNDLLNKLETSMGKEVEDEASAKKNAEDAIKDTITWIEKINRAVSKITEGKDKDKEEVAIAAVYELIVEADLKIMTAKSYVRKLTDQKSLLNEIAGISEDLNMSKDDLYVKEVVRLTNIASASVNKPKNEIDIAQAKLDIAAARRAISKIIQDKNKATKLIISNTINTIESKLTSDNDQELIDAALEAVNYLSDRLSKAVREDKIAEEQEGIEGAIFSAKISIGWISSKNKDVKDMLTGFINDIEATYNFEKDGIKNEERIKNAEKAVVEAEAKKGSDDLEGYIRSARLRVSMIKNNTETEIKIIELNGRLDALEGKSPGSSTDKPGSSKPGESKPGGNSNTNKIPTVSNPPKDGFIEVNQPKWGKTKELKQKSPTIKLPKKR